MTESSRSNQESDKNSSPKHGSSPKSKLEPNTESISQPDGTAANAPRGETQAQPQKHQPADTGSGKAPLTSQTPEAREGRINPSAPNDATSEGGTGATSKMPANTTRDSAGEIGEPSGEGTLDAPKAPRANEEKDKEREKDESEEAA
jgi:hypothetical protein